MKNRIRNSENRIRNSDRELMQIALDVMEAAIKAGDWEVDGACDPDWVLNALRARLAQPEREWQGLTDDEVDEAEKEFGVWRGRVAKQSFESGAWWANEKLLEKNT